MSMFKDNELVKIQGRIYPVVGGRLRVLHDLYKTLSIRTEIIHIEPTARVMVKATIETEKGTFQGTGAADESRDKKLKEALLELAETRAIARAARFAGAGTEYTGAEEVSGKDDDREELAREREEDRPVPKAESGRTSGTAASSTSTKKAATTASASSVPAEQPSDAPTAPAAVAHGPVPLDGVTDGNKLRCSHQGCGKEIERVVWSYSLDHYGRSLCRDDQKKYQRKK